MVRTFTEQDTETYYDGEDAIYRQLWDEDGKVHWGVFDDSTGDDFFKAGLNHDAQMVELGQITKTSRVLDMGCGNGTVAMWLSRTVGCEVTGIDLSGVRIGNAQKKLLEQPSDLQSRMSFEKASATNLPFDDASFSHVWSQAVIYHVHEQKQCLQEAYRVIEKGGIFVFDDLYKPTPTVSPDAQKYVYERLLFDTEYNFVSYQQELADIGFDILQAHNLSPHLAKSYDRLADIADGLDGEHKAHFEELALAYRETVKAIDRQEVGWGLFVCRK